MVKFTPLESNIEQLIWVSNRLDNMHTFLLKQPEERTAREVIREYLVLQLFNFIQIRKKLVYELRKIGLQNLDIALSPFWKPVIEQERAISELRHSYFAHIQQNGVVVHIQEIVDKHQFPSSIGDLLLYSSCVIHYSDYLLKNLEKETQSAQRKYKALMPVYISYTRFNRATFGYEILKFDKQAKDNLKKLSYKN